MNLSTEERQIVTNTWAIVAKDLNAAGIELFMILFTTNPSFQNYFSFRDVPDLATLREDKRLKAHARNVMFTLSMVVNSLNDPEVVGEMVHKIARSHLKRNLDETQFTVLKGAVVTLLVNSLGPQLMNEQALTAWSKTYDLFTQAITDTKKSD